ALIDSLTATSCVTEGGLVLADEECNEPNPEVCCLFEGFQTTIPLSECTSEGGVPSPVEACEATTDICCLLPCGSTVSVPADACEAVGGTIAPEEMCEPCCLLPCGQAVSAPADACELVGGTMTSGEMCSPEACCTLPCGMHSNMPASACIAAGGTVSPVEVCDAVVCCSLDSGTVTMTSSQCTDAGGEVVNDEFCLDEEICCAFEIGQPIQATAEDCLEQGGLVVDHTVCENPEVCCMFADGSTAQLSQQECHDQGGEEVSPEACEPQDAICCVFDDGSTAEITPNECEAQGGIIGTPEQCEIQEPTCCLLPQGTTILMTPSECAGAGGTLTTMDQCESPCATDVDKNLSLIVTDTAALELFPHDEVLGQILATSGSTNATQTANTVFQQWWGSQRERTALDPAHHPFCDDNGGQINGFDIACPRAESVLENHVPNTHTPVALVNRFDLAPLNGGHCGEYRIVYALTNGAPGRNFIIYEAVLPNPDPACGIESCRPVAEFWASLTDEPDASVRAALLQDFYFNGLPGFAPVIQAAHYGLGSPVAGQIRTNQFMGGPWNLREFNTALECDPADPATCDLLIRQTTVKGNPSPSVVDGSAGTPLTNDFETDFIAQLPLLTPATEDINQLLMDTSDDFNTGESISQGGSPNSSIYFPSFALATAIDNALPVTSNLGSGDIIARLQTQTCGGCHQTSGNANLGTQDSGAAPLMWPAKSPMFVHIDENSTLSNALVMPGGFLDARKSVLEEFLVLTCDGGCNTPQLFRTIDGSLTADVMSVDKGVLAPSTSNKMKDTLSGAIVH
ncbi:MAG: hypothetical protein VX223_00285, partial [Myxococcota bacterium]|nr:hypothetical protein [Myxococcota bacterium]